MPIEAHKKEGENIGSFLFRFNKRIKQSGILKEAKKRKFSKRPENKRKRRLSALYREEKEKEIERKRKLGRL
ncbi:30S ribosomal protein S21 [bacterium]|nr:30S ribosomal protein S21 [bacterium]|tara:strand:+ start:1753 stop:1968 length:216 start_codon:yes stop_codon:yes gene_type:complete